jgi:hypothetical protein
VATRGTRAKTYGAHFLVEGVNLGDGESSRVWVHIDKGIVTVRPFRSRRSWTLPLDEAAGMVARAAQVRAISRGAR